METLYFDVLQFIYHLALAVLVGGAFALGAAAAPAIFGPGGSAAREPPVLTRAQAGTIFGAALARFDGLAILAVIAIALTTILKATAFEVTGVPDPRLIVRWAALVLLALATLYSSAWANPVARSIRASTPGFDDLPANSPARLEFATLHARSRRAMSVGVLVGLVAIFLS
ncbi:MAG: hypothetical protein E6I20_00935 [Chloroflexi bacterium]|nr:MAG: hypothetical protein E6I20_00935 [Chloroflexota bacterium]